MLKMYQLYKFDMIFYSGFFLWLTGTYGVLTPIVPCPEYFEYQYDGYRWYGIVEVPSPRIGQALVLNVIMSLRQRLINDAEPGSINLLKSMADVENSILQKKTIQYRVLFPPAAVLPKLTKILYNKRVICSGPPEHGAVVTAINLEHILHSNGSMQVLSARGQPNLIYGRNHNNDPVKFLSNWKHKFNIKGKHGRPIDDTLHVSKNLPEQFTKTEDAPICGQIDSKFKIKPLAYGGKETQRGAWPWLVAIYQINPKFFKFKCGGNLVSEKAIITAGHCVFAERNKLRSHEILMFIGRYDMENWSETGSISSSVENIFVHPDYQSDEASMDGDIAIITMKPIEYSEHIKPICLWSAEMSVEGAEGVIVGWGRTEFNKDLAPRPRKVSSKIVSDAICLRSNPQFSALTSNRTFCAGNLDDTGPCTGDSGGGFMIHRNGRWMLRGIVSASLADPILNTCNLKEFVVYTDVAKFINWIKSLIS